MTLPTDYQARKDFPLFTVLAAYFPDAIEALVALCVQGNMQHKVDAAAVNPFKLSEDTITWDRSKSTDQLNTMLRHAWDHNRAKRGTGSMVDSDGILHIVKAFWRAGAEAQLTIERMRAEAQTAMQYVPQLDVPACRQADAVRERGLQAVAESPFRDA